MSTLAVSPAYTELLLKFPPRILRTEEENERCVEALYELDRRSKEWSAEERDFAELLTLLIEDFEERHYGLPKCSPVEMVSFLMEQQGLKQKDLTDVFGTASIVSEVMNGKREMNKEHIRRLSERFQVSPELFF
jgi:HTH-type transcriptional regulator/antitoxin HigA